MKINYLGEDVLEISFTPFSRESVTMIVGPLSGKEKLINRVKPDIVLNSRPEEIVKNPELDFFYINERGEYEIKRVFVQAFSLWKNKDKKNCFRIQAEDISVFYLDPFSTVNLKKEEIEELGRIDIFIFSPWQDKFSAQEAKKIISQLEPRIIILTDSFQDKQKEKYLDDYLKECGLKKIEKTDKISLKKKDLTFEGRKTFILEQK